MDLKTNPAYQIVNLVAIASIWVMVVWWVTAQVRHLLVKHTRPWWTLNNFVVFWRPFVRPTTVLNTALAIIQTVLVEKHRAWVAVLLIAFSLAVCATWWYSISHIFEDEDEDGPWNKLKSWIKEHTQILIPSFVRR